MGLYVKLHQLEYTSLNLRPIITDGAEGGEEVGLDVNLHWLEYTNIILCTIGSDGKEGGGAGEASVIKKFGIMLIDGSEKLLYDHYRFICKLCTT